MIQTQSKDTVSSGAEASWTRKHDTKFMHRTTLAQSSPRGPTTSRSQNWIPFNSMTICQTPTLELGIHYLLEILFPRHTGFHLSQLSLLWSFSLVLFVFQPSPTPNRSTFRALSSLTELPSRQFPVHFKVTFKKHFHQNQVCKKRESNVHRREEKTCPSYPLHSPSLPRDSPFQGPESPLLEGKVVADIPPNTLVFSGYCTVMYKFLSKLYIHTLEPAQVRGHYKL